MISRDELLIASEVELFRFNVDTLARSHICSLDAANSLTRSNDGRADPWGLRIGTMGKNAEQGAGAIYRFYRDGLERLYWDQHYNSICFCPAKPVPITQIH